jgi:hypothetical protein
MNLDPHSPEVDALPPAPEDDETSLPLLPTWPSVYKFVVVVFLVYVVLLTVLSRVFA